MWVINGVGYKSVGNKSVGNKNVGYTVLLPPQGPELDIFKNTYIQTINANPMFGLQLEDKLS